MKSEKMLYIVAGANGSGKTTFAMSFSKLENLDFINADEIAKKFDPNDIQNIKSRQEKLFLQTIMNP